MKEFMKIWAFLAFVFSLVILATPAQAKGAVAVAARAAPVSVARPAISTPVRSTQVKSSTSSVRRSVTPPVAVPQTRRSKSNYVNCYTLKRSKHAADREVYGRYCR